MNKRSEQSEGTATRDLRSHRSDDSRGPWVTRGWEDEVGAEWDAQFGERPGPFEEDSKGRQGTFGLAKHGGCPTRVHHVGDGGGEDMAV